MEQSININVCIPVTNYTCNKRTEKTEPVCIAKLAT